MRFALVLKDSRNEFIGARDRPHIRTLLRAVVINPIADVVRRSQTL